MPIAGTGYVGMAKEATYGTAVDPTVYLPVESAEASQDPQNYYPAQIRANRSRVKGIQTAMKNELTINQDCEPNTIGYWLLAALGAVASSQPDATNAPNVYQHAFRMAHTLPSWTVEKYDNIMTQQITGAKMNSLKLSVEAGGEGVLKAEASMLAQDMSDKAAQSVPDYTDKPPFVFDGFTVEKDGVANDNVRSAEIEINNNLKDDHYTLSGSKNVSEIPEGMREVKFSAEMYFKNKAEYLSFTQGDQGSFKLTFTGAQLATGFNEELVIDLPVLLFDSFGVPMGSNDDEILASIEGTALYDVTADGELTMNLTNEVTAY